MQWKRAGDDLRSLAALQLYNSNISIKKLNIFQCRNVNTVIFVSDLVKSKLKINDIYNLSDNSTSKEKVELILEWTNNRTITEVTEMINISEYI